MERMPEKDKNVTIDINGFMNDSFIGTRHAGNVLYEQIEKMYRDGVNVVTLDFGGILTISKSAADAIMSQLTEARGITFIKNRLKLVNEGDDIRTLLNNAIIAKKKEMEDCKNIPRG